MEKELGVYLTCHSCGTNSLVLENSCDKCGSSGLWGFGNAATGGTGIFCQDCGNGFTSFDCHECGVENAAMEKLCYIKKPYELCFIATAAYGDYNHPQVIRLRNFRDNYLVTNFLGRSFTKTYYRFSPRLADWLQSRPKAKKVVRSILNRL
jgi:predicted amidophosphoribosyltransferase